MASRYAGTVRAPDFPDDAEWIGPRLSLRDLRGKVVMLDFWTSCCINCMHVVPNLHELEQRHPDELVVIGVHSAKFPAEQITTNIAHAVARHGLAAGTPKSMRIPSEQRIVPSALPATSLVRTHT